MQRFKALDIFRGMTLCLMIIVNTPGSWSAVYAPFLHAPWHGFTLTDLVFPSFLFAVGNAFAFVKNRWADKSLGDVFGKIAKRTFLIFLIGYLLSWFPFVRWNDAGELYFKAFGDTRVFGVLQRIALCYFGGALLIFFFNKRQLVIASGVILLGYWAVMYGLAPDMGLENNFARTVDRWILSDSHLYKGEGIAFDPEGLLSTFPAIVNVIGGYLAGAYLIMGNRIDYEKIAKLLLYGCVLMGLSYLWDFGFPINKKIWTSSYVLLTVGINLTMLAGLVYLIDFKPKPMSFKFFEVFGMNSLFIYILSSVLSKMLGFIKVGDTSLYGFIYQKGYTWMGAYLGSFLFAVTIMLVCWAVGKYLYERKIYIKV